jgi:hypothetical protein
MRVGLCSGEPMNQGESTSDATPAVSNQDACLPAPHLTAMILERMAVIGLDHGEATFEIGFVLVRPEGACHQWRTVPPRELSIDLVADERLGRVTGRAEAS